MNSLGQKVRKARKEKGLTQKELADNNISRSMLSLIESDSAQASMATLSYLAQKLGKSLSYFLSDEEEIRQKGEEILEEAERLIETEMYGKAAEKIQCFFDLYDEKIYPSMNRLFGSLYTLLGISCFHMKEASSSFYLARAVELLTNTNETLYLSKAYNHLSLLKYAEKDYTAMESLLIKADSILGHITPNNVRMKLNISYNLAFSCYMQKQYQKTIELIHDVLAYCRKYEVFFCYGDFNMLASLCYKNINDLEKSMEYNHNAVRYYELSNNVLMLHRNYNNLSILYRITGDNYHAIYYIDKASNYFKSIGNIQRYINAIVEKIITLFVFHAEPALIRDLISTTINHPQINQLEKGELFSILGTLELRDKNYDQALKTLLLAQELVSDSINSEMNIFIYRGLYEIYEKKQDHANSMLYKSKLDTLLEQKPYYR